MVDLLQTTIVSNSFYCVDCIVLLRGCVDCIHWYIIAWIPFIRGCVNCIHHTLAILPTSHNFCLMFANQLWADHFGTWLNAKLFYSVHKKLRTCGVDFKYYEVADLRLRTELLKVQLRTCGRKFKKLKFGCGFADCGLKKKLAVPSTEFQHSI